MKITYNAEYERRLKIAFIGCGGHAQRNIYPTFQFAPVELAAVCDLDRNKAEHCARIFGAKKVYTGYAQMMKQEKPEAVFVVTNYDENCRPRFPLIAMDVMRAGAHVWIEKPPAASSAEVLDMMRVSRETGKFVGVGFKKMFFPANVKAKEISQKPEFGRVSSITARYPQPIAPHGDRHNLRKMVGFLDHIVHPYSVLRVLGGDIESIYVQSAPTGGTVTLLRFMSGAVGSLHMPWRPSGMTPLEYTEIVGDGANVIVDNNVRVVYYRPGAPVAGYGRESSFFGPDDMAPLVWEPEFSLGQLYNKGLFLLGYAPEVIYFCECALQNREPEVGNLHDALELLRVFEAYCNPDGEVHRIAP